MTENFESIAVSFSKSAKPISEYNYYVHFEYVILQSNRLKDRLA